MSATELESVWREIWAEYAIGNVFILLRFYARWKVIGIRNFHYEDVFILTALVSQANYKLISAESLYKKQIC